MVESVQQPKTNKEHLVLEQFQINNLTHSICGHFTIESRQREEIIHRPVGTDPSFQLL